MQWSLPKNSDVIVKLHLKNQYIPMPLLDQVKTMKLEMQLKKCVVTVVFNKT